MNEYIEETRKGAREGEEEEEEEEEEGKSTLGEKRRR